MTIGFMIKDEDDFKKFVTSITKLSKMKNSFIQMLETKPKMNTKSFEDFLEEEDDDYQIV
jgi:hypothetical protein